MTSREDVVQLHIELSSGTVLELEGTANEARTLSKRFTKYVSSINARTDDYKLLHFNKHVISSAHVIAYYAVTAEGHKIDLTQ